MLIFFSGFPRWSYLPIFVLSHACCRFANSLFDHSNNIGRELQLSNSSLRSVLWTLFRRNISPPSTEWKGKPSKKTREPDELSLSPASAGFLCGLHFDPVDGDDIFLRNFELCLNCKMLQSKTSRSSYLPPSWPQIQRSLFTIFFINISWRKLLLSSQLTATCKLDVSAHLNVKCIASSS
jgi:hypothetical protein